MYQTNRVIEALEAEHPDIETEIVTKDTLGDRQRDQSIPDLGEAGVFTQALELALFEDRIDCAVHSLKDLRTRLPEGLGFAGALTRGNPTDAFVSDKWSSVSDMPSDGMIATGSRRRQAQFKNQFPDISVTNLRGNIETRLKKMRENDWDGIVMATTALERLDMTDRITTELPTDTFVPAVSQGAIGLEIKDERDDVEKVLNPIFDQTTTGAVTAERQFLRRLEGGCSVPVGGYCTYLDAGFWEFSGWVGDLDGDEVIYDTKRGSNPVAIADQMATDFIDRGAKRILEEARNA